MRKMRSESYGRFCSRLISATSGAMRELEKQNRNDESVKIFIEECALRTLRRN